MASDPERRGATLGGPHGATLGGEHGATLGAQRPQTYRVVLTTRDGRRLDISATASVTLKLEHTAVSGCSIDVPRMRGVDTFQLADLALYYGDSLLFSGTVEGLPGYGSSMNGTLTARGPARTLARGDIDGDNAPDYSGMTAHVAIRNFWADFTRFDATVIDPVETTTIPSDSDPFTGTPMQILQDLHELAGMRFTVQHTESTSRVESYQAGQLVRQGTWTLKGEDSYDSSYDWSGYANFVRVLGGIKSDDTRAVGEAEDTEEIDRLGFRTEPWVVRRPDMTSDAACAELAQSILEERADANQFSGSIDIWPELILPGYAYEIPEFDNAIAPIERVTLEESFGDASGSIEINPPTGDAERIAQQQREIDRIKRLV